MKDWVWIVLAICFAAYFVVSAIDALSRNLTTALAQLTEKLDEVNEKVDAVARDIDDIEGYVSGRKDKYINPIDRY